MIAESSFHHMICNQILKFYLQNEILLKKTHHNMLYILCHPNKMLVENTSLDSDHLKMIGILGMVGI